MTAGHPTAERQGRRDAALVDLVTDRVAAAFRTWGLGTGSLSFVGKRPDGVEPAFASGVPVRDVVRFALEAADERTFAAPRSPEALDDDLSGLMAGLGRHEAALDTVGGMVSGAGRGEGPGGVGRDAGTLAYVTTATASAGASEVREAILSTLRDLVAVVDGEAPVPGLGLAGLLDRASANGDRPAVLPAEVGDALRAAFRHRGAADAVHEARSVLAACRVYVPAARRALLVAVLSDPATLAA